jgi:hypothetical protein
VPGGVRRHTETGDFYSIAHQVAHCANRGAVVGGWFGTLAVAWDAVDGPDSGGSNDLNLFDELLDERLALQ